MFIFFSEYFFTGLIDKKKAPKVVLVENIDFAA
jgi:hypothetical protein